MSNDEQAVTGDAPEAVPFEGLVDFEAMGRRLVRTALVLSVLVVVGWVATFPFVGVQVATLMNLMGIALALMFVAEVVIVGGSAVRGLLRAGERGERLSSGDVGLLPPQVVRRLRR